MLRIEQPSVDLLSYEPEVVSNDGAILWMFGGGHWAGQPQHLNAIAGMVARELGVKIYVPNYRLAPEHPFPGDLDDCYEAWSQLVSGAVDADVNPNRVALAGHSAGGGLAAALAQRILDEGGVQPIAQCLFYPMLDDRCAADRSLYSINHFVWNNRANRAAWRAYIGPLEPGSPNVDAYASPARRDKLAGLPPAWIGMCELDLFYAEYLDYAERLKADGVSCDVYQVAGAPHAFEVFKPAAKISQAFQGAAIRFLKDRFDTHAT